jgi:hypothetical protein
MKLPIIIVSLVAMFCLVGCSDNSSDQSALLVPRSAGRVMKSPAFKLEHTTEGGIQCYVRPLVTELARTITVDNPDFEYLKGDDINPYYLLVLIRKGKIIDKEAVEAGALSEADQAQIDSFVKTYVPKVETAASKETAQKEAPTTNEPSKEMPKEGENK